MPASLGVDLFEADVATGWRALLHRELFFTFIEGGDILGRKLVTALLFRVLQDLVTSDETEDLPDRRFTDKVRHQARMLTGSLGKGSMDDNNACIAICDE